MFSTSLRSALITLATTAAAAQAAPGLSLKVSGPDTINDVENFKVITTLINTGDETLKLLNDPRSALHTFATNTFAITTNDGASPAFTGVKVKYSPSNAAKMTDPSIFTVLRPGESVLLIHDRTYICSRFIYCSRRRCSPYTVSSAYNFTSTGHSNYTIEASNLFHFVNTNNDVSTLRADAQPHVVTLTGGKLAVARPAALTERARFTGCSPSQQSALKTAATYANKYAASALAYLQQHASSPATPRYEAWFGAYTPAHHALVQTHFARIGSHNYTGFAYDCRTCADSGTFAMVDPGESGTVYPCGAFWDAPTTGTDSQAGTLIHEVRLSLSSRFLLLWFFATLRSGADRQVASIQASHFTANGGTDDYVYGQDGAESLARSDPGEAVMNADSHEYFAENHPALS